MKKWSDIQEALDKPIPPEAIHPADSAKGIYGDYVTAQWAMQESNAVFGTDSIETKLLADQINELPKPGLPYGDWMFTTTVEVVVAGLNYDGAVVYSSRLGRGVGAAQCPYDNKAKSFQPVRPQQFDTAAKAALSDATKNALMRFGRHLGAELYFNEREAQLLGYMQAEEQLNRREREGAPPAPAAGAEASIDDLKAELEDVGKAVCEKGIGKKLEFKGWTVEQMWSDANGQRIFTWAENTKAKGAFNEALRRYKALMGELGDAVVDIAEKKEEAGRRMIMVASGQMKPYDEIPDWAKVNTPAFHKMLASHFNTDGKIADFGPSHPRMMAHYKKHFGVETPNKLTWAMLDAILTLCKEGLSVAAFKYPEFYQEAETEPEAPLPVEVVDVQTGEAVEVQLSDDAEDINRTPKIIVGGRAAQHVPSGIQVLASKAGIPKPDEWIWEKLLGKTAVDDWTVSHTDLAIKIIATIEAGNIGYDDATIGIMWKFGVSQIQ